MSSRIWSARALLLVLTTIFSTLLELGLSSATVREGAIDCERDPGYVRAPLQTGSAIHWAAYLIPCTTVWVLAPVFVTSPVRLSVRLAGTRWPARISGRR